MTSKLIITGFMATGKTVVGHLIAGRIGWRFIDSDSEIVARAGKPIPAIFAEDGEAQFRALERETIVSIAGDDRRCPQSGMRLPAVISTGGGVLADEQNCSMLKRAGIVVCLTARPEIVAARVGRSAARRPKLVEGGRPLEERIRELMKERSSAYARADITIDTSDVTPDEVAERVMDAFFAREKSRWKASA